MNAIQTAELVGDAPASFPVAVRKPRRLWVAVLLVAAYWIALAIAKRLDLPIYAGFFTTVGLSAALGLALAIWWLTSGGVRLRDRFLIFLALIAIGVATVLVSDKSVGPIGLLFFAVPVSLTIGVIWLLFTRNRSAAVRNVGVIGSFVVLCGLTSLIRIEGVDGDQQAAVHSRWSKSAEDLYLAERTAGGTRGSAQAMPSKLTSAPGDWTDFRGPDRLGEVRDVKIATDWQSRPPELIWKQRIGPAWSSILVVGNRLFTQEQRDKSEAVVCLDAATGHELWSHEYLARWSDGQAGAGPRSTPVFHDGRLYAFGATGVLNCLDAANGKVVWSRDVAADSAAATPMWGFSGSPLVVDGVVIVYAGGKEDKGLLAYAVDSGKPAWSVAAGPVSYSSPQVVTIRGMRQVLFLSDAGLVAVELRTGKTVWEHKAAASQMWRVALPRQIDEASVVVGSEDMGLVRLDVTGDAKSFEPSHRWETHAFRPAYNDFVSLDGFIYGFDESFFCCIDAATGKRRWKGGRYGHGQVLLLLPQKLLLVTAEDGQAVLVSARPDRHEELGRFQAVTGKTWNHPAIARGCLFVRNAEEIACYKLPSPTDVKKKS